MDFHGLSGTTEGLLFSKTFYSSSCLPISTTLSNPFSVLFGSLTYRQLLLQPHGFLTADCPAIFPLSSPLISINDIQLVNKSLKSHSCNDVSIHVKCFDIQQGLSFYQRFSLIRGRLREKKLNA